MKRYGQVVRRGPVGLGWVSLGHLRGETGLALLGRGGIGLGLDRGSDGDHR